MFDSRSRPGFWSWATVACLAALLWAGCGDDGPSPEPFELRVTPTDMQAIPGQRCVLLVELANNLSDEPVNVSATASAAAVEVLGQVLVPAAVAEVEVVPEAGSAPGTLGVTITGRRGSLERKATVSLDVLDLEDGLAVEARAHLDMFLPWLAAERVDLGLTAQTVFEATIVRPQILVVMHYLFYTDTWEIDLIWHVTIAPHDWTRIFLRRRFQETLPSLGFEISSVSTGGDPHEIDGPFELDR